jgi:hypothetical protein
MVAKKTNISLTVQNDDDPIIADTASTKTDFIFMPSTIFDSFMRDYDDNGVMKTDTAAASLLRYKYLPHVHNINTQSIAVSAKDQNVQGLFSIVIAHRVGPWEIKSPTQVVIHLVSLEGIEAYMTVPTTSAPLVALCLLYSWIYQCLVPDSVRSQEL